MIALAILPAGIAPAAESCESITAARVQQALDGREVREGLRAYLRTRLAAPRYFETGCTPERS